ncbi:MAG: hypothetical protein SPI54_02625 [Oscillospiraceae bacterium]|nr:hypothetical protein [Oscillospiraceae bacterium]
MKDITFFTEFPPIAKAVPLKRSIVAVGIENLSLTDKFEVNADGLLEKQEYCRTANIKTRLSICVPYSYGGSACHDIFTRIIDALNFKTDLNISESGCDETQSDRNTNALVLNGWFKIIADFCPAENADENYKSFLEKEFICGSHIRDTVVHVTKQDKENWNNPLMTGFYLGNGASSRTINFGFKPRFIAVFSPDMPNTTIDFSSSKAKNYFAVAADDTSSNGVQLTSTGFRVTNKTVGSVSAAMNEAGTSYCYIAMK